PPSSTTPATGRRPAPGGRPAPRSQATAPARRPAGDPRRFDPRRGFEPEFGHRLLPHLELLDLAGDRHRELVGELDVAGHLVVGDLPLAELLQGLLGQRGAWAQLDPGHEFL